jgi:NADPH-dependent 2,4-dienoyl-CoA reductase/sulfur reductase-like enzyme
MGLGYATSNRGACHLKHDTFAEDMEDQTGKGKAKPCKESQDSTAALDSTGICLFTAGAWGSDVLVEQVDAACEGEWTVERYLETGERVWNLERQFNMAAGLTAADDSLPKRLLEDPAPSGTAKGKVPRRRSTGWALKAPTTYEASAPAGTWNGVTAMNYVIVGAGPAGVIAAENLRRLDRDAKITLIGAEAEPPYSRMALPYFLVDNIGEDGTHLRHSPAHYERLGIELRHAQVREVDPLNKNVNLHDGEAIFYDKLLIATGSHAARPPIPGIDLKGIENCWTLDDARRIAAKTKPGDRVVLMGAGFIGLIVLEALAKRDLKLTVVEMADRMLPRMMDEAGGAMIKRWCERKGVTVLTSTRITGLEEAGDGLRLALEDGGGLEADLVVCATGVKPNIELLEGSRIKTGTGILIDHYLRTNEPDIFAAGDVAEGPDFSTGKQEIHAIQPTASEHGRIAALNMAGQVSRYRGSLSMNVLSTLGLVSSSYGLWMGAEGGERAVALNEAGFKYLRLEFEGDILVGALAIGLTQHVGALRGLIQTRVKLGAWKDRLLADPHGVMSAYLECTQGSAAPHAGAY